MKLEGFKNLKLKNIEELTDEEKIDRTKKEEYLEKYGVNIYSYTNGIELPRHPDGIHCYAVDSYEAYKLVMNENKDLPEDLKERLLYYKKIMRDNDEESTEV